MAAAAVLGPVGVVQMVAAFAQGDTEEALNAVENIVDGPLWVADPVLFGLRDALPAPLGGPGALVENFRNGLWSATERTNEAIGGIVGQVGTTAPAVQSQAMVSGTFEEKQVTSIPNSDAPVVNLLQQEQQQKSAQPESTGLVGEAPKETKLERNVVRQSPNYSTGTDQTGQNPTGAPGTELTPTGTEAPSDPTDVATTDTGDTDGSGNEPGGQNGGTGGGSTGGGAGNDN
ncbi:hypothetical protein M4D79_05975 [Mycolicibacterium novocastrense]|nr:hypothetical protein M4D79_05975 [Mycolicibacterium novocastrense]